MLLYCSCRSCHWPDGKDVITRGGGEKAPADLSLSIHSVALDSESRQCLLYVLPEPSESLTALLHFSNSPQVLGFTKDPVDGAWQPPQNCLPHSSYRQENNSEMVFMPLSESYVSNVSKDDRFMWCKLSGKVCITMWNLHISNDEINKWYCPNKDSAK